MRPVFVHLLPALFEPADLRGGIAVVIDVLRASTTICHALAAGAESVRPTRTVDEATALARTLAANSYVLGGERGGLGIEGFDLGNTPTDYDAARVGGKTVVFTTTNGTAALDRCREAAAVYVGCFANISSVFRLAASRPEPLHLVCAGTNGVVTAEDVLCAGAINDALHSLGGDAGNDAAQLATAAYRQMLGPQRLSLEEALGQSRGGRNLIALGLAADITTAAKIDSVPVLPRFDAATGQILALR